MTFRGLISLIFSFDVLYGSLLRIIIATIEYLFDICWEDKIQHGCSTYNNEQDILLCHNILAYFLHVHRLNEPWKTNVTLTFMVKGNGRNANALKS